MSALFWHVAGLSLVCSAVLLPLRLASPFIGRRYSARTCYFLWLLLALRLILPFPAVQTQRTVTVEVPRYEIMLAPGTYMEDQTATEKAQNPVSAGKAAVSAENTQAQAISLTGLLPGLWLAGVIGCCLWMALSYAAARRALLGKADPAAPEDEVLLEGLSRELGCKRQPALYRSGRVDTPILLGLLRPVVLVPQGELDRGELSVMLRHELTHLRRRDVAYKLLLQFACMVHWFNPLVWWMARKAGQDLELCCDEDVVRGKDEVFRCTYGEILLKAAAGVGKAPALSARMSGGKGYLKARLNNLFVKKKTGGALVCAVLAAALLGGALVSCTEDVPEQRPGEDGWKAKVVHVSGPEEPSQKTEAADAKSAVQELADSTAVSGDGTVTFVIPAGYQGEEEWQIEIRGRMELDGTGGMSLHIPFDRVAVEPGMHYTYDLTEQWASITELYLWASLGGEGVDVDLLALAQENAVLTVPGDGEADRWFVRDAGGFGGNFYIHLESDGTFCYCAGMLSSYIGMGTWTCDGETLCMADEGMQDSVNYYYFKVDGADLVFQAEHSAEFAYVDVADGERFSQTPVKPAYFEPNAE